MTFTILAIGDIHLGKRPSRLPPGLHERIDIASLTPAAALRQATRTAIDLNVDAVCLAGDVVEQPDDFFEAYGDLDTAVRALSAENIPIIAVSGNHDTIVLPRLAGSISGLHLLGAEGRWERTTLSDAQGNRVHLVGWSFPASRVTHNPLDSGLRELLQNTADPGPIVGLLHCDRDQAQSPYAPVTSRDLLEASVDAWLLGHIHKPDSLTGSRPIGYLGCLSPADPGEDGGRGPWLLTIEGVGHASARQLIDAPLRYERLQVELPHGEAVQTLDAYLTEGIRSLHARLADTQARHRVVACRLELIAHDVEPGQMEAWQAEADPGQLCVELDGTLYCIEKVQCTPHSALDLRNLAKTDSPAGILAHKLLVLEREPEDAERRELITALKSPMAQQGRATVFAELACAPLDDEQVAAVAADAGRQALQRLLKQSDRAENPA